MQALISTCSRLLLSSLVLAGILSVAPPAKAQTTDTINLQVEIFESGNSLDFGVVEPFFVEASAANIVSRRIRLNVSNPSLKSFRIIQIVNAPPVNPRGVEAPLSAIRYFSIIEQGSGTLRVTSPQPLGPGEQEIYISNRGEEYAQILLQYDLALPAAQSAGRYNSSITYRVYED